MVRWEVVSNHFLEVQVDEEGSVWVMIHSGSRNMGKRIGDHFNSVGKDLNDKWHSNTFLPFLPANSKEGKAYLAWMDFALRFAFLNRQVMIEEVKDSFKKVFPTVKWITDTIVDDTVNGLINIHHNYASMEHHYGRDFWVHRKGAIRVNKCTGLIPGSMGTSSYVVKSLNSRNSFCSASHGAGRKMGRRDFARRMKHSYAQIEKSLEGVIHTDFGEFTYGKDKGMKDVSEAPGAYRDIDEVMANQTDLVKTIVKLSPKVSIKG